MNAFEEASKVEAKAMTVLQPYIAKYAYQGRYVTTMKGRLSFELQRTVGDILVNDRYENVLSIEVKAEEENLHGNFFLETWSNLTFERRKPGWMKTLNCDFVWYYFLQSDDLYIIDFKKLYEWAFVEDNFKRFKQAPQKKRDQPNKTYGKCVPIPVLRKEVGFKLKHPKADLDM